MTVEYKLDYSSIEDLQKKYSRLLDDIENFLNTYLHKDGAERTIDHITKLIKVSRPTPKANEHFPHAKTSKWSKVEKINLGFTIKPKGGAANKLRSFGYLAFPNEGRGPRNPLEQRFMERGLENSLSPILEDINELVERSLR